MTALLALRAATAEDHARVDACFGGYDLADREDYARFLKAHARALPAAEAAVVGRVGLPTIRPRAPALKADLDALGLAAPATLDVRQPRDAAEAYGMAYVIEGSRLGGSMLARTVPDDLPKAYLSATFLPGEWRAFGAALDGAGGEDAAWIGRAIAAAKRVFALYAQAADAGRT